MSDSQLHYCVPDSSRLTLAAPDETKWSWVVAKHIKGRKQMPLGPSMERLLS